MQDSFRADGFAREQKNQLSVLILTSERLKIPLDKIVWNAIMRFIKKKLFRKNSEETSKM
ncbi:hypothetical protein bsdcttw_42200 [Anaerocolumna chitinilytica]|uniref:Uncharacterized protein n=1 Tax=Anaerocolumna chitinilytica TaxID=1727145 RepID=A0A7M3S9B2_9FIRM|nr:hypothetical protein bsdcttw_42200 [Anaerocolumna chitinilytica]